MTKKLVIYRGFGTALHLRATLLTPSFRELLANERHRLLGSADAGDAAFRASMKEDGTNYHEIVFAADSSEPNAKRFGNAEDRWNLKLNVGNQPVTLLQVEEIKRPTTVHQALYPQLNIWSDLWIARFERDSAQPGAVTLSVGSGYGNGEVRWET
ncbi:MAG: hypothetical protein GWP91_05565 [Rhodobacterales bacterium]|nr:hypothetical protein [Rhodobacterales bacterium]